MAAGDITVGITSNNAKHAAIFNGATSKIELGSNSSSHFNGEITLTAYIKRLGDEAVGDGVIVATSFSSHLRIQYSTNKIVIQSDVGTSNSDTGGHSLEDWTFVAFTIKGTALNIYAGANAPSAKAIPAINSTLSDGCIGARVNPAIINPFNGGIRDVKIFNRELSTAEITKIRQGGIIENGLIHEYPLYNDYEDKKGSQDGTATDTYLQALDDAIDTQIASQRVDANTKYMIAGIAGGQVVSVAVEE